VSGPPDPERVETSAVTPRRMSHETRLYYTAFSESEAQVLTETMQ